MNNLDSAKEFAALASASENSGDLRRAIEYNYKAAQKYLTAVGYISSSSEKLQCKVEASNHAKKGEELQRRLDEEDAKRKEIEEKKAKKREKELRKAKKKEKQRLENHLTEHVPVQIYTPNSSNHQSETSTSPTNTFEEIPLSRSSSIEGLAGRFVGDDSNSIPSNSNPSEIKVNSGSVATIQVETFSSNGSRSIDGEAEAESENGGRGNGSGGKSGRGEGESGGSSGPSSGANSGPSSVSSSIELVSKPSSSNSSINNSNNTNNNNNTTTNTNNNNNNNNNNTIDEIESPPKEPSLIQLSGRPSESMFTTGGSWSDAVSIHHSMIDPAAASIMSTPLKIQEFDDRSNNREDTVVSPSQDLRHTNTNNRIIVSDEYEVVKGRSHSAPLLNPRKGSSSTSILSSQEPSSSATSSIKMMMSPATDKMGQVIGRVESNKTVQTAMASVRTFWTRVEKLLDNLPRPGELSHKPKALHSGEPLSFAEQARVEKYGRTEPRIAMKTRKGRQEGQSSTDEGDGKYPPSTITPNQEASKKLNGSTSSISLVSDYTATTSSEEGSGGNGSRRALAAAADKISHLQEELAKVNELLTSRTEENAKLRSALSEYEQTEEENNMLKESIISFRDEVSRAAQEENLAASTEVMSTMQKRMETYEKQNIELRKSLIAEKAESLKLSQALKAAELRWERLKANARRKRGMSGSSVLGSSSVASSSILEQQNLQQKKRTVPQTEEFPPRKVAHKKGPLVNLSASMPAIISTSAKTSTSPTNSSISDEEDSPPILPELDSNMAAFSIVKEKKKSEKERQETNIIEEQDHHTISAIQVRPVEVQFDSSGSNDPLSETLDSTTSSSELFYSTTSQ